MSYELERVLKIGINREDELVYLVRWKDYGSDADEWISARGMKKARGLINDFTKDHPLLVEYAKNELEKRTLEKKIRFFHRQIDQCLDLIDAIREKELTAKRVVQEHVRVADGLRRSRDDMDVYVNTVGAVDVFEDVIVIE